MSILDSRFSILDCRCSMLDSRFSILDCHNDDHNHGHTDGDNDGADKSERGVDNDEGADDAGYLIMTDVDGIITNACTAMRCNCQGKVAMPQGHARQRAAHVRH